MMELNRNFTKSMPRKHSIRGDYTRENTYVRTWGLERGEGVCSKEAYFWELTVPETCGSGSSINLLEFMILTTPTN